MRAEKKKRLNLRKGGIENQLTDDANPVTIGLGDQTHSLFTITGGEGTWISVGTF
jgi:hypothetical protein